MFDEIIYNLKKFDFIDNIYAVGGCVRDAILGLYPKDFDLSSPLRPSEFITICNKNGIETKETGINFGTVTALINGQAYEHTTFRSDHNPDGRHCDVKYVSTIEEDLARRDFTINAMAVSKGGALIDPYDGCKDLKKARIRTVGKPEFRFKEDHLRIIRALRFAARFEFSIEEETFDAIVHYKRMTTTVSKERIAREFDKAFQDNHPARFLRLLRMTGLLHIFLPEIYMLQYLQQAPKYHPEGSVFEHLMAIDNIDKKYRWEYLLHDVGKGTTAEPVDGEDYFRFPHHDIVGIDIIEEISKRFKLSNELTDSCKAACRFHMQAHETIKNPSDRNIRRLQNRVGKKYLPMLKEVCRVDAGMSKDFNPNVFKAMLDNIVFKSAVTGSFLMKKGYTSGKKLGDIKKKCLDIQLETGETDPEILFEAATGMTEEKLNNQIKLAEEDYKNWPAWMKVKDSK